MPIDRDHLLAPKSSHGLQDNTMDRLEEHLQLIQEPQTKQYWMNIIQKFMQNSDNACATIFNKLIVEKTLTFLRIYQGHAIYTGPTTPVTLHNKMPVIGLET